LRVYKTIITDYKTFVPDFCRRVTVEREGETMFGKRLKIFKLFGFEVWIDLSWLIIAVLIVWSLARGVFPLYYEGLSAATYWWMGVLGAIGLFASIIFHEMSHSLVARRFGLPMKGITLFVFGGVAEMHDEPPNPKAEFFMAVAGPLASVVIAGVFWGIYTLGQQLNWPPPPNMIFNYLWTINLVLAIFNMLPAFPLDGGRVLRSILWNWKKNIRWATRIASRIGSGFGLALIVIGVFTVIMGGVIGGIWWALIGLFLRSASQNSYQSVLVRSALEGEHVKRFMKSEPVSVSADTRVDHLVEDFIYKYHYKLYPVVNDGKSLRCVTIKDVKHFPKEEWNQHTVGELAEPCSQDNTVTVEEDALKALSIMNKTGNSRLMVVDDQGNLAGVIALKDMLRFLSLKLDLEESEVEQLEKTGR